MSERKVLFDSWAASYDAGLENATGFSFEGCERVLAGVVGGAGVGEGDAVLDVGTGTGALAVRLAARGCRVLGDWVGWKAAVLTRSFPVMSCTSSTCRPSKPFLSAWLRS